MNYEAYVKDVFIKHHNGMGMSIEETMDPFNETVFTKIERWLIRIGYDLQNMYTCDCQ